MTTITPTDLATQLDDPSLTIVDVRPIAAYNGWRLGAETRGGHIPGAVAFPLAWLETVEPDEIDRLLASKGVTPERRIVVAGTDETDAARFADHLAGLGITDTAVLDGGVAAWTADADRPVDRLPNHERLVHIDWLRDLLDGGRPEGFDGRDYRLLHVNFGVPDEYAEGHLPGAAYLDTNQLEDPADWNRRTPDAIAEALRSLGVTRDTTVIVYGRDTVGDANEKWPGRRAGQIAATRAALILRYAGVRDVRLLDGGYDWWVNAGLPIEAAAVVPAAVAEPGLAIPEHPELMLDIDDAKAILADQDGAALVSVRTWREHIGAVSGYNYIGPAGRIKGDVWGNCGSDAYHMQHYRNVDNTMRAYPEIVANWAEAGITPDKHVAFYCGTGWRAAETWFYADLLDWPRIAVYDGGWYEWSLDPVHNPIEVGQPDGEPDPAGVAA